MSIGLCNLKLKNSQQAIGDFEYALNIFQTSNENYSTLIKDLYYYLGWAKEDLGKIDEAIEDYQTGLTMIPLTEENSEEIGKFIDAIEALLK